VRRGGGPTNTRSSQFADVRRCSKTSWYINQLCVLVVGTVRG
jgi:hypothetical protein